MGIEGFEHPFERAVHQIGARGFLHVIPLDDVEDLAEPFERIEAAVFSGGKGLSECQRTDRSESKKSATARDFLYIQQPPKLKTVAENNGVEDTGVLLKTQMFSKGVFPGFFPTSRDEPAGGRGHAAGKALKIHFQPLP